MGQWWLSLFFADILVFFGFPNVGRLWQLSTVFGPRVAPVLPEMVARRPNLCWAVSEVTRCETSIEQEPNTLGSEPCELPRYSAPNRPRAKRTKMTDQDESDLSNILTEFRKDLPLALTVGERRHRAFQDVNRKLGGTEFRYAAAAHIEYPVD